MEYQNNNSIFLETARGRILYIIDYLDIKPKDFLEKTGLKKGFIDKYHQNSGISDLNLAKILTVFPEINAEWLVTGNGEMMKTVSENAEILNKNIPNTSNYKTETEHGYIDLLLAEKDKLIEEMNRLIEEKEKRIILLEKYLTLIEDQRFKNNKS